MPTLSLILDGTPADLPSGASIRLNQAANQTEQLDVRLGERSYAFVLPPTRTNHRLFKQAAEQLQLPKFKRTAEIAARLLCDGVDTLPAGAFCRLQSASKLGGYKVNLFVPGWALGETLGARKLADLTSLPDRAYYDYDDLQDLINGTTATEVLCAPLVSYGNFFSDDPVGPISGTLPPVWAMTTALVLDDYLLSVYASRVLTAIFKEAGYRIEGEPLANEDWQNAAIPYTRPEPFPWPWASFSNGGLLLTPSSQTYIADPCELLSSPQTAYDNPTGATGPISFDGNFVLGQMVAQAPGDYRIYGYINTSLSGGLLYEGGLWLEVRAADGAAVVTEVLPRFSFPLGSASTAFDATVVVPGRGSTIRLISGPFGAFGGVDLGWSELSMQISFFDGITTIKPATLLPDMTQKDFVKAFLTLTNSAFVVDDARKVVRFSYRDRVTPADAEGAIDLADYVNPDAFEYSPPATYAQVAFAYAEDSADAVAITPERIGGGQGAGWADTTVSLAGAGRADTRTVTVPFAATATRRYSRIDTVDQRTLPTIADLEHLNQPRLEVDWSFDYAPRLLRLRGVTDSSDDGIDLSRRSTFRIAYQTATSYPTWAEIVAERYQGTLEQLDRGELAKGPIRLTPSLYRALTPGRLVRLNGVLYSVNQLDGYQPGGTTPATIELLRYVPPSGR